MDLTELMLDEFLVRQGVLVERFVLEVWEKQAVEVLIQEAIKASPVKKIVIGLMEAFP
jgi:hypothetical protein